MLKDYIFPEVTEKENPGVLLKILFFASSLQSSISTRYCVLVEMPAARLLPCLHQVRTFFQIFCCYSVICLSFKDCMDCLFAFQTFSIHSVLLGGGGGGVNC